MCCRLILPGNPGICGSVPGTLQAARLTPMGSTTVLMATSFGPCPTNEQQQTSNDAAPIVTEARLNTSPDVLVALVPRYASCSKVLAVGT